MSLSDVAAICITPQWADHIGPKKRLYDYKSIYQKWLEVKTYQGTGKLFGISDNTVMQIVKKYRAEHGM